MAIAAHTKSPLPGSLKRKVSAELDDTNEPARKRGASPPFVAKINGLPTALFSKYS
jgi:hypothetical protein